ncbi:MAG: hypothetical protein R3362_12255, partial [Rhodothermales bacterium]|nr:hypothetical protein [Rhodothermales bacterium]
MDAGGARPRRPPRRHAWWLEIREHRGQGQQWTVFARLREGDLDGVPTGREVSLPIPEAPPHPYYQTGVPFGLAYDAEAESPSGGTGLFFYADYVSETLWAVGLDGAVPDGYPAPLTADGSADGLLSQAVDGSAAVPGPFLEVPV